MKKSCFAALFLLGFTNVALTQINLSGYIAGGYHFPKMVQNYSIPGLYTPALTYEFGLSTNYQLTKNYQLGIDLCYQSFAYRQRYFDGTFQHNGVSAGLFIGRRINKLNISFGAQYVYITKKTFGNFPGFDDFNPNPNFLQARFRTGYHFKRFLPFISYDHGLTPFNEITLPITFDNRKLFVRKISIGVQYLIKSK
jgi:hypothetical protein